MSAGPEHPESTAADYPARWESDVVLRDGATAHLRPIRPADAQALRDLHARLSPETIYFRFFSPLGTLSDRMVDRFVRIDYRDRMALVAELHDELIAVARYERLPATGPDGDDAEVAFLVDDAHQGRGLGTVLLEHLAAAAREAGISRFVADTLAENARMLGVFRQAGFGADRTFADGVVRVVFPIEQTEASEAAAFARERAATSRSVRRLLAPSSVALVGASRRAGTLGNLMLARLLAGGFDGPVYPVNPEASHVRSVRAFPTVVDIPDRVDLAVVVVPAASVPDVVEQCIRKHVGGLVIISSGFAERDPAGRDAERRLVADARRNGMRVIGPNSMGAINTDPAVGLNATHVAMPPHGRIGLVAQSGTLGAVILDEMARRGLGVSTFVSAGNKADVSGNDLLQYWDDDPATDLALMYIEGFGNPRSFARIARRVSQRKPVVAVKSRRSPAGRAVAGAGRGDLEGDTQVDALFRRAGVIRTESLEELFDVAQILASQPLPPGRGVAIVANSGGPGVLAADACSAAGLDVVELAGATEQRLRAALPSVGSVANPIDVPPEARPEQFRAAIDAALGDEAVHAVIALYASPLAAPVPAVTRAMLAAQAGTPGKPVLACALGRRGLLADPEGDGRAIPSFAFPEAAAHALGRVADYAEWRRRPEGSPPALAVDVDAARSLVGRLLGGAASVELATAATSELCAIYGIDVGSAPAGEAPDRRAVGVEVTPDPVFGPLVTLRDGSRAASRALPLTDMDAVELRVEILGRHDLDVELLHVAASVEDLLLRVGRLVDDLPEVVALTFDPVSSGPGGLLVGGARLRLARPEPHPERAVRRLRR